MRISLVNLLLIPIAFILGARWYGATGVAAAWLFASPLTSLPSAIILLRRIELRWWDYLTTLWPTAASSCVMVIAITGMKYLMAPHELSSAVRLSCQVGVGATAYTATLLLFFREKMWRYVRFLDSLRTRNPPATEA
jgi:hypothetical protein